jgi:hypothetical protein
MKSNVYKRPVDTRGELIDRIVIAAARENKSKVQLIRTKHELRTRVAKCTEADSEVFRIFIVKCNNFVISMSRICLLALT